MGKDASSITVDDVIGMGDFNKTCRSEIACSSSSINSRFLSEGISFLQYLYHISLYLVSKSFVNFTPLQIGDVSMSSLRLILRLESESMSEAN